jgi:hypothetical protein
MTLQPSSIAMQGFGYGPSAVAMQGFSFSEIPSADDPYYFRGADDERDSRIDNQNRAVIAIVMALAAQGEFE